MTSCSEFDFILKQWETIFKQENDINKNEPGNYGYWPGMQKNWIQRDQLGVAAMTGVMIPQ